MAASAVGNSIIITPSPSSSASSVTVGNGHHGHGHISHNIDYGSISLASLTEQSSSSPSKDGPFKRMNAHPSLDHHYANLLFNGATSNFQTSSNCFLPPLHHEQLPSGPSSSSQSSTASCSSSQSSSSQSSSFSAYLSSSLSSTSSSPSSSQSGSLASSSSNHHLHRQNHGNYNNNVENANYERFTPKACSSKHFTPSPFNASNISKLNQVIKSAKSKKASSPRYLDQCNHKNQRTLIPHPGDEQDDGTESDAENYERISRIGEGTYGVVFKARDLRSRHQSNGSGHPSNYNTANEVVAMKRVTVPLYEEEGIPITLLREISLLKSLENYNHPNIVKLLDICTGKRIKREAFYLYLIFEHVDQDLASYLANCPSPGLCPSRIKEITYFILKGIDFLHSNRIVHRDLKPSNVLVAKSGQIKLADFGLARIYESSVSLTTTVVTLWYRSPEVLLCTSYASSIDIWSIGCIFAELFTRRALITGNSEADQLSRIFQVIGSPPAKDWPEDCTIKYEIVSKFKPTPIETLVPNICVQAKELIMKMLTFNPKERISAKEALRGNYFEEYENHPPFYEERELNFEQEIKKKQHNALMMKSKYRRRLEEAN